MQAKLVVVGGKAQANEFPLKLPAIVGRSRGADVPLAHPLVSRQHCELFEAGGRLMVRDLGSLNGTFVGEARIKDPVPLAPGGLLTIGSVTFRAVYDGPVAADDDGMPDFTTNGESGEIDQTIQVNGLAALEEARAEAAPIEDPPSATNDEGFDMLWLEEEGESGEHASAATEEAPSADDADLSPPGDIDDLDMGDNETKMADPKPAKKQPAKKPHDSTPDHDSEPDLDDEHLAEAAHATEPVAGGHEGGEAGSPDDLDDFFRSLNEP